MLSGHLSINLEICSVNHEVALRMLANRADFRSLFADNHVTAV